MKPFCMDITGKAVLVTGGGRGIGKGLALAMGQAGADIALTYHTSAQGAKEVVTETQSLGRRAIAISANLARIADAQRVVRETVKSFGRLDILVYNAGITVPHSFLEITEGEYDLTLDLNLKGAFFCAQEAARSMIAQKISGRIVVISSVHGFLSFPKSSHYAASKAGLNQFVRTVANELAPYGITVNAVAPGAIEIEKSLSDKNYDRDLYGTTIPLGRIGYPRDVAGAVIFLASDAADYITGTVLYVDGGIMTRSPHYLPGSAATYPNYRVEKEKK